MLNLKRIAALATPIALAFGLASPAAAQEKFLGEIMFVGYNFCPNTTASAEGQLLAISSNTALFSLYGTTFGGDGRTSFGLPDLRGRAPMGLGNGPGLTPRSLGQKGGVEYVTLNVTQMPSHNHLLAVDNDGGDKRRPANDYLSYSTLTEGLPPEQVEKMYATAPTPNTYLDTGSLTNTGGGQLHENMQPFTVMRYCVVMQGVYPPRS
jgi:microcystin-dependent protein